MTTVGTEIVHTPRVDAVPKVTGRAVYTEDLPLPPGTLYGAILRSPYAHARPVSIDAQRAERLPGVHAVVTREHLGDINPFLDPATYGAQGEGAAPLIALEKVRYVSTPSAAAMKSRRCLALIATRCACDFPWPARHSCRPIPSQPESRLAATSTGISAAAGPTYRFSRRSRTWLVVSG